MVQTLVSLGTHEDRILTIVKGKYGFRNKSDAINFVIDKFENEILEPHLRPEYANKLEKISKQNGAKFKSMLNLRKQLEDA